MPLDGQVAAITGGTGGIGRAIAEEFVAQGAKVVVGGRNAVAGQHTVEEFGGPERARFHQGDVACREVVDGIVGCAVDAFGQLDVMVLNAGGGESPGPVYSLTDEQWDRDMRVNLHHVFWGLRRSLQVMIPRRRGSVIVMSSIEGRQSKAGLAGYSTAKHALCGLTRCAALDVEPFGITVNAILPGLVDTDKLRSNGPAAAQEMGLGSLDELVELFVGDSAIGRPNTVEEVAAVALFLASDVGRSITGGLFPVDGGTLARARGQTLWS